MNGEGATLGKGLPKSGKVGKELRALFHIILFISVEYTMIVSNLKYFQLI